MMHPQKMLLIAALAMATSCSRGSSEKAASVNRQEAPAAPSAAEPALAVADDEKESGGNPKKMSARRRSRGKGGEAYGLGGLGSLKRKTGAANERSDGDEQDRVQTRSWFPETFLFRPLIVTDERGRAELKVRVPDRLTSWRVLALAHGRNGAQAGHLSSFLGTLPVYVEPVVPPRLRSGDVVRLPINVVNTTQQPVKTQLALSAEGIKMTARKETLALGAASSAVRYAELGATLPGKARLLARLGTTDAVVRTIDVLPRGRPVTQEKKGTLAAKRELKFKRPAQANPALGRVRLAVFFGALAILRAELASSAGRGGTLADDAFSLLLAGKAKGLLSALGEKADAKKPAAHPASKQVSALRDLTMVTTQRVMRHARVLTTESASLLAQAALAHGQQNALLSRLGERAVNHIVAKQAPDGTCGGESGWTLQRLLVATAECARAAASNRKVKARASLAFERNAERIKDPYTAAAVLASGAVSATLGPKLRKLLLNSIKKRGDGARAVVVPKGVVRADGSRPSVVEATALAVLALRGEQAATLADLGATILVGYSPGAGWGDGRANVVCFEAALKLFNKPIPKRIEVVLKRGDKVMSTGTISAKRVRDFLVLEASTGAASPGGERWTVDARPAVPGLGFALRLTDRVPWDKPSTTGGVELLLTPPKAARVGKRSVLAVRATAPGGRRLEVRLELPAGVSVDKKQLDKLVAKRRIQRYKLTDASLQLFSHTLRAAQVFSANVHVVPTLAGRLYSGPSSLRVGHIERFLPPMAWAIK